MEEQARYLVGIDLGTTNSAIAYVDALDQASGLPIRPFSIPQLTSRGFVEAKSVLPSFCYLLLQGEWSPGEVHLPWKQSATYVVGELAKEQGALVPTRLVASAKSWLCNAAADRSERILPPVAEESLRISPVEATKRYLGHLRDAWNHLMAKGDPQAELEQQEVVVTVPASFDEVARTLTARAAQEVGLTRLTLLEEPQAAFYDWIRLHEAEWTSQLSAGQVILVCDVGGGTTDFSLIQVIDRQGVLGFERLAVGDHLLLGGDNMDAFLAHRIAAGIQELSPGQWLQLQHEARKAKELLLAESAPIQTYSIQLQASGSRVVEGRLSIQVTAEEVKAALEKSFFGIYERDEALRLIKRSGIRSMGLPYEEEPSITKHLAHFLFCQNTGAERRCPDFILFNGGAMKPPVFQEAITASLAKWYGGPRPVILKNSSLDLSVSRGAAYYGKIRRGMGVKIGGGIPRSYYLRIDVKDRDGTAHAKALTLLPRGSEEGSQFEPDQTFALIPNRPVSFRLLSSHVRLHDAQGALVAIIPEEMQTLPPLHTVIRYGKSAEAEPIPVHLGIALTPIGTVSIWLRSVNTPHRWNLEFQVRSTLGQEDALAALGVARQDEMHDISYLENAKSLVVGVFQGQMEVPSGKIMERLEQELHRPRREWPSSILRALADAVLDLADQRQKSLVLQRRWWNLLGFCLRPGFGYPVDDYRMQRFWKVVLNDVKGASDSELEIQRSICCRRLAGGLNKGQQTQLANVLLAALPQKLKGTELYPYTERIRTLAAFELIDSKLKQRIADILFARIESGQAVEAEYWALGRLAARQLLFGSLAHVIPVDLCCRWLERVLSLKNPNLRLLAFPIGQMVRRTAHPELNVPQAFVDRAVALYAGSSEEASFTAILQKQEKADLTQQEQLFGESLPSGLMLWV